jgi:hypothetical protein
MTLERAKQKPTFAWPFAAGRFAPAIRRLIPAASFEARPVGRLSEFVVPPNRDEVCASRPPVCCSLQPAEFSSCSCRLYSGSKIQI